MATTDGGALRAPRAPRARGGADLGLATLVLLGALLALRWLVVGGVGLTQDDGFYYLRIAQHLAAGHGSTFDGLHPTNGYHPLWLLCLAAVFRLQPDPPRALAAAIAVQALLAAAAAAIVYLAARATMGRVAGLAAAAVWFALTYPVMVSGVEFAVHALLYVAAAALWPRIRRGPPAVAPAAWLGVVLALAVLARLDNALLVALIAGALLWRGRSAAWPAVAALGAPVALALAAYLAAGQAIFGEALPVSGMVKRAWSSYLLAHDPLYLAGGWPAAKLWQLAWPLRPGAGWPLRLAVALALAAAVLALTERRRGLPALLAQCADRGVRPWMPFVAYGALQYAAYALAYHGHYTFTRWYYVAQPLAAALLMGAGADRMWHAASARTGGARAAMRLAVAAVWALVPLVTLSSMDGLRRLQQEQGSSPLRRAARWAGAHLPADARVGTWNAGTISFLSGRQVVNLDGLVNSAAYFRREQYDLCGYWDRTGITHLVDVFEPGSARMTGVTLPVTSFYARCASRLELLWEEGAPGDPGWPKAFRLAPPP